MIGATNTIKHLDVRSRLFEGREVGEGRGGEGRASLKENPDPPLPAGRREEAHQPFGPHVAKTNSELVCLRARICVAPVCVFGACVCVWQRAPSADVAYFESGGAQFELDEGVGRCRR